MIGGGGGLKLTKNLGAFFKARWFYKAVLLSLKGSILEFLVDMRTCTLLSLPFHIAPNLHVVTIHL